MREPLIGREVLIEPAVPSKAARSARGRLPTLLRRFTDRGAGVAFGARLALTLALTLGLVAAVGYVELTRLLERRVIEQEAVYQRGQAEGLEAVAASGGDRTGETITRMIEAASERPGTHEVLLIDARARIVAAHDPTLIGRRDTDARIAAAVEHGAAYAGREGDRTRDIRDFEFVTPVELPAGRFAFETTYDNGFFGAEVAAIRRSMALLALLGLIGGGAVFYLVGGRTLTRIHRLALERATLDGLTDLGNQRAFQDDLAHAVAIATRNGAALSLALVDIDDFKFLNDRHGHRHGDEVLLRVARILAGGRASDRAFRIGGDEFALLLPGTGSDGSVTAAHRLRAALGSAGVPVSIGVSSLGGGDGAATLRDQADAALAEVKRRGGNGLACYDEISERVVITTSSKVEALRSLLAAGTIDMAFQPIWDLRRGCLLGVEALARPAVHHGFSGPAEAFDIAEQTGRVHELDMLCVESALRRAAELPPDALLFVNIAPRTLDLDAHGDGWLVAAVERSGIDPERIVIEVTERFGGRMSSVVKSLDRLRAAGLKLALDDVGAGNSGLEMLSRLNVEFVKIDRGVVTGAMSDARARAVLLAIATFAGETGALVIAEGIEDDEVLRFLDRLPDDPSAARPRIHGGQGFGLGRPEADLPMAGRELLVQARA